MDGTQMKQIKLILTDGWYTDEKVGTQMKQIKLILTDGWYTDETDYTDSHRWMVHRGYRLNGGTLIFFSWRKRLYGEFP
jgi:predicted RNA binding protein YcfA (HicA-like mRNA interferase family)